MSATQTIPLSERRATLARGLLTVAFFTALMSAVLFLSAGTLRWLEAWIFLGLYLAYFAYWFTWGLRNNPDLILERSQSLKRGGKDWDRIPGASQFADLNHRLPGRGPRRRALSVFACKYHGANGGSGTVAAGLCFTLPGVEQQSLRLRRGTHPNGTGAHGGHRRPLPICAASDVCGQRAGFHRGAAVPGFLVGTDPGRFDGDAVHLPDGQGRPYAARGTAGVQRIRAEGALSTGARGVVAGRGKRACFASP